MASVVEGGKAMTRYQKAEKVAKAWSASDEKRFQKLLKQRQRVAWRAVRQLGDLDVDYFSESIAEDYNAISAWEDLVNHSSPMELLDQLDYAGVFEDKDVSPAGMPHNYVG